VAKESGLGDALWVSGVDLSGDIGSLGRVGGGPALGEVTGIDKLAFERIGLVRDGGIDFNSWWNPTGAHQTLRALPTTDTLVTYCRSTVQGAHAASEVAKQVNYDGTRGADGSLTHAVNSVSNGYGVEWGNILTNPGKRTDTVATSPATGVDLGAVPASYSFGLAAYLHVFAFTGTSVTVAVQDSADNSAFSTIATFAAASAVGWQRVTTATATTTVRRYLRVITTGTFSNAVFGVTATRFETAQP
jgi:hypothetical protein